jgi:hypothetical protein
VGSANFCQNKIKLNSSNKLKENLKNQALEGNWEIKRVALGLLRCLWNRWPSTTFPFLTIA